MTFAAHDDRAAVPFGGTLTFKRFLAVQKALRSRWAHPLVTVACVVWLLSLWNEGVVSSGPGMPALLATLTIDGLLACIIGLAVWAALRLMYRLHWRRLIRLHGAVSGSVAADGIGWNTAVADSRYGWDRIVKAREADGLVLLHYAPRCALYFPREFFANEAAWEAFRSAVRTYAHRA